ncbi:MAG TPA: YkgJ family cysteine cluster protein [Pseudomonadales bacterium]|nr:YkgJ family cysteine cluster protein [Pseudomonadales bacterium]
MIDAVDQLCTQCGLCCDGTLFADVELRAGDDAKRLKKLGLSIYKKEDEAEHEDEKDFKKVKKAFVQPCACFDGRLCKIYGERPGHCRLFECGLLKRVNAGEMKPGAALKKISSAKTILKKLQDLLGAFEGDEEGMALSKRYERAMGSPMDLAEGTDRHGELMRVYGEWMEVAQGEFLRK